MEQLFENPETARPKVVEPSFYNTMRDTHGDTPQPTWESVLSEKVDPGDTVLQTQSKDLFDHFKSKANDYHGNDCLLQDTGFSSETKAAIKQLVPNELSELVEEIVDDLLCTYCHIARIGIQSVVYIVIEQMMLDLFYKDVFGGTINEHIANF